MPYHAKENQSKNFKKWRSVNKQKIADNKRRFSRTDKGLYSQLKYKAKCDGREVSISFDQFKILRLQPCFYCSGPLSEAGYSLDRKINSEGYTPLNTVPCCKLCNRTKASRSADEFIAWAHRISANALARST